MHQRLCPPGQVAGMVVTGLERGSERLVRHLFAAGDLIGWLTRAPEQVTPPPDPADRRAGAREMPIQAGF